MQTLNSAEVNLISGGSVLGVLFYGSCGFWIGGITGLFLGGITAIPGAVMGMGLGAYLGTDSTPTIVYVKEKSDI